MSWAVWVPSATLSSSREMWRLPSRQGGTLAAALVGEELLGHAQKADDAGAFIHHQHRAGADGGEIRLTHALVGVGGVQLGGGADAARRAAKLHQAQGVVLVLHAAGQIIDDLPDGDAEGAPRTRLGA